MAYVSWTDASSIKMLTDLKGLFDAGYVNADWQTTGDGNLPYKMAEGEIAMMYTGPWTSFAIYKLKADMDLGWFYVPDEKSFVETYIMPVVDQVSNQVHTELSVGIGMQSTGAKQLKNAYKTAKFAFELYYFEEKLLIDFKDIHKDYMVSFEDACWIIIKICGS